MSTVARFFIMQIIATNLCIWLLTVILEATEEISHHDYEGLHSKILFKCTQGFYLSVALVLHTELQAMSGAILAQGVVEGNYGLHCHLNNKSILKIISVKKTIIDSCTEKLILKSDFQLRHWDWLIKYQFTA